MHIPYIIKRRDDGKFMCLHVQSLYIVQGTSYVALGAGDNSCHVIIAGLEFILFSLL